MYPVSISKRKSCRDIICYFYICSVYISLVCYLDSKLYSVSGLKRIFIRYKKFFERKIKYWCINRDSFKVMIIFISSWVTPISYIVISDTCCSILTVLISINSIWSRVTVLSIIFANFCKVCNSRWSIRCNSKCDVYFFRFTSCDTWNSLSCFSSSCSPRSIIEDKSRWNVISYFYIRCVNISLVKYFDLECYIISYRKTRTRIYKCFSQSKIIYYIWYYYNWSCVSTINTCSCIYSFCIHSCRVYIVCLSICFLTCVFEVFSWF